MEERLSYTQLVAGSSPDDSTQFNAIRIIAFPEACLKKDNDSKSSFKRSIFCDETLPLTEMKTESDGTVNKRKNEDFFKELDKDRQVKKCEYAAFVSMLEADDCE